MTPEAQAIIVLDDVQLIGLDHRDAQFVRAELTEKIAQAIAAAVAAEREECALTVAQYPSSMFAHEHGVDQELINERDKELAAAIRARGDTH